MLKDYTRHLSNGIRFEAYDPYEYENIKGTIIDFCSTINLPTHSVIDWETTGHASLLNAIYVQRRFDSGLITIGYDNDIPICISGCHDFPGETGTSAIVGSRTYIKEKSGYEPLRLGSYLTGIQSLWLKEKGYKFQVQSFNDHNISLCKVMLRRQTIIRDKMLRHNLYWPSKPAEYKLMTLFNTEQHTLIYEL
jgi:hypothetical protein